MAVFELCLLCHAFYIAIWFCFLCILLHPSLLTPPPPPPPLSLSLSLFSVSHSLTLSLFLSLATKNGEGGLIKLPVGISIRKSVATGQQATAYRAEACALLVTAQTLNQEEIPRLAAGLPCGVSNHQDVIRYLAISDRYCPSSADPLPRWCWRHEKSDLLSKMGCKLEQSSRPMS